jgi:hypothetical protein
MKKNVVSFIMLILILICILVVLYFVFNKSDNNNDEIDNYNGAASVIERKSANIVLIKINNENSVNELEREFVIYSDILNVNDQLKVKYKKSNNNINIEKIENYIDTEEQKEKVVESIYRDENLKLYKDKITINIFDKSIDFFVLPIKISNKNYITLSSNDFIKAFNQLYDYDGAISSLYYKYPILIKFEDTYKVLEFTYLNTGNIKNINYKVNNNIVTANNLKNGIYSFKLEFENGDILAFIFLL